MFELPKEMILERGKIKEKTRHGIGFEKIKSKSINHINVRGLCERFMEIAREGLEVVDYVEDIFNRFYHSNCMRNTYEFVNYSWKVNSITRFEEPLLGPIQIPNPIVVHHKV